MPARPYTQLVAVTFAVTAFAASTLPAFAQALQFPHDEFPLTDVDKRSVDMTDIQSGGPPRDGIPSIDKPVYVSITQARDWLEGVEPVIALQLGDVRRAYPLQILMYHEIVNDSIGDVPVLVTFCPLCNASIVFERTVEGSVLDFGTTGRLRHSDLVMYDRQSESWWQQFTGRGIIGKYDGVELPMLESQIVSFDDFADAFPDGEVLSRDTGYQRPYGNNPYAGYDRIDSSPFLFRGEIDPRLRPMERVLSIVLPDGVHLVPLTPLVEQPVVNLEFGEQAVTVFAATTAASALDGAKISTSRHIPAAAAFDRSVGQQRLSFRLKDGVVVDEQTASVWNAFGLAIEGELAGTQLQKLDQGVHFAFAWLAFDPEAEVVTLP